MNVAGPMTIAGKCEDKNIPMNYFGNLKSRRICINCGGDDKCAGCQKVFSEDMERSTQDILKNNQFL